MFFPFFQAKDAGHVEITPLSSVTGYKDRNWQSGYGWMSQVKTEHTGNGQPYHIRQQDKVAEQGVIRIDAERKSSSTDKGVRSLRHSDTHGFRNGLMGTNLIPRSHHTISESNGFVNKAFLGDNSDVSGSNVNTRMGMHDVNERIYKNSGFSFGV